MSFGSYALWSLGWGLYSFIDCPDAYKELLLVSFPLYFFSATRPFPTINRTPLVSVTSTMVQSCFTPLDPKRPRRSSPRSTSESMNLKHLPLSLFVRKLRKPRTISEGGASVSIDTHLGCGLNAKCNPYPSDSFTIFGGVLVWKRQPRFRAFHTSRSRTPERGMTSKYPINLIRTLYSEYITRLDINPCQSVRTSFQCLLASWRPRGADLFSSGLTLDDNPGGVVKCPIEWLSMMQASSSRDPRGLFESQLGSLG